MPLWPAHRPAGTQLRRAPSRCSDRRYLVNAVACECPDHQKAGHVCKHVRAVRLYEQHEREIEQAFADVARCRSCGERTAGSSETFCPASRRRLAEAFDRLFGGSDFD